MAKKNLSLKIMGVVVSSLILMAGCGNNQSTSAPATSGSSGSSTDTTTSSSSDSSSNKVVDISFWNGHPSGALQQQMHKEVNEFNQTHPKIHVSYVDKYSQIQTVSAAFAAHKAPNVAMPHLNDAQAFAKAGYLVDLTPYMSDSQNGLSQSDINSDYYPTVWKSMQFAQGKNYLLPYEESASLVIYYNQDLFKKAGITQTPKTWADIQTDAQKITALGTDYHGIAWTPMLEQFFVMTKDFGGQVYSDNSQTKFDLNNSGAKQALTMLTTMAKNKTMLLTKNYSYQVSFGAGKAGILMDASTGYTYDLKSAGGKFKMVSVPAPTGSQGTQSNYAYGDALAMFNTGTDAQKQAAWTFMKWLSSPSVNAEWNKQTNYIPTGPISKQKMASFYSSHPNYAASFSDPSNWITINTKAGSGYTAAMNEMLTDFQKALNGQESVSTALKNMNTIGNEYLSGQKKG